MDTNRQITSMAAESAADELAWRAFRYLHGELTADEAEAFEEDLAIEQSAREALAQVVELSGAVEAAGKIGYGTRSVPTTLRSLPAWWRRLARPQLIIGTAVAACLVVAVTLGIWGRFGGNDHGGPGPDNGNAQAALAKAWAEIGPNEEWRPPPPSPEHESEPNADDDRGHGDHEEDLNLPGVPSWMLAAVDLKSESREMKQ